MNNYQIERLLSNLPSTSPYFKGVLAADELEPHSVITDEYYIVNLDPSWKEGSHWVAIKLCPEGRNEYFDSYGWPPPYEHFLTVLETFNSSTVQIQDNLSTVCGQYCIFYVWCRIKGLSLEDFISLFSIEDNLENDTSVNRAVEMLFNTDLPVINTQFLIRQVAKALKDNQSLHQEGGKCLHLIRK